MQMLCDTECPASGVSILWQRLYIQHFHPVGTVRFLDIVYMYNLLRTLLLPGNFKANKEPDLSVLQTLHNLVGSMFILVICTLSDMTPRSYTAYSCCFPLSNQPQRWHCADSMFGMCIFKPRLIRMDAVRSPNQIKIQKDNKISTAYAKLEACNR